MQNVTFFTPTNFEIKKNSHKLSISILKPGILLENDLHITTPHSHYNRYTRLCYCTVFIAYKTDSFSPIQIPEKFQRDYQNIGINVRNNKDQMFLYVCFSPCLLDRYSTYAFLHYINNYRNQLNMTEKKLALVIHLIV